ncbi:MAG TPA: DUF6134 family protein [Methylophilus sp.]|nr:DUF6134 family protein [Methylophilus sp.]
MRVLKLVSMTFFLWFALSSHAQQWSFNVLLDGKPIGKHVSSLKQENDLRILKSEAIFNVKILFVNAYNYHHTATETWEGDCLTNLVAQTKENGSIIKTSGKQKDSGFMLDEQAESLGECVMTFAYWNPKILGQQKLLNPQTGDYLDSKVKHLGTETIQVRGEPVKAAHHVLDTPKFKIDLWYNEHGEWMALQSTTPEGRKIRYTLQ